MTPNPFDALGLPARPDLTDAQVAEAWRAIAAATHPDRADGGDLARYTQASAAFAELRTPWSRSEAYADLVEQARAQGHDGLDGNGEPYTEPLPPVPPGFETDGPPVTFRPLLLLPERIWHGHPLRLALRAIIAAVLSMVVLALIPGSAAAPADVFGVGLWFVLTARSDLAPPSRRSRRNSPNRRANTAGKGVTFDAGKRKWPGKTRR